MKEFSHKMKFSQATLNNVVTSYYKFIGMIPSKNQWLYVCLNFLAIFTTTQLEIYCLYLRSSSLPRSSKISKAITIVTLLGSVTTDIYQLYYLVRCLSRGYKEKIALVLEKIGCLKRTGVFFLFQGSCLLYIMLNLYYIWNFEEILWSVKCYVDSTVLAYLYMLVSTIQASFCSVRRSIERIDCLEYVHQITYNDLLGVVLLYNDLYGASTFFLLCRMSLCTLEGIFMLIDNTQIEQGYLWVWYFGFVVGQVQGIALIMAAEGVAKEQGLLGKALCRKLENPIKRMDVVYLIVPKIEFRISAAGFYNVGHEFLFSFFKAQAAYLIGILQCTGFRSTV